MRFKLLRKKLSKVIKIGLFLRHYLKQSTLKSTTNTKRIIICFDGIFPHGGLVDRLKGIVSFYEVAKLLNYEFYIQFDDPFHLDVFLKPNKVNWRIQRKDIKWHLTKTRLLYVVNNFEINPLEVIKQSNADTFIVYANIDYFKTFYKGIGESDLEDKWRASFNQLFAKTKLLKDKILEVETDKYISIHTRFTSLMGDFVDSSKKTISEAEKQELLNKLRIEVKWVLKQTAYKCYVFSDSVRFLNYINSNEAIHLVEGNPFHMDNYKGGSTLDKHLKTMLDFFMLVNSEAIYFLKVSPMYHSSFSKYAAIIGNKPFNVISKADSYSA